MASYYNGGYQNPFLDTYQQQLLARQQQFANQQMQSSGLISVRNEMEARNYPLAPGNSITFKDESQPYVYVKTMGLSQFDQPNFEKFRLVKEEAPVETPQSGGGYALQCDLESIRAEIERLKNSLKESA